MKTFKIEVKYEIEIEADNEKSASQIACRLGLVDWHEAVKYYPEGVAVLDYKNGKESEEA